jgi:hypothetical protein
MSISTSLGGGEGKYEGLGCLISRTTASFEEDCRSTGGLGTAGATDTVSEGGGVGGRGIGEGGEETIGIEGIWGSDVGAKAPFTCKSSLRISVGTSASLCESIGGAIAKEYRISYF